jgi:lipid-A-disaccharide synthase
VTPLTFMIVAGEPSGDQLAAELVAALRRASGNRSIRFIGAGGEKMAAAGVELLVDLTRHSVIGIPSLREVRRFQALRDSLVALAQSETPDVFIGVDFFGFNGSLARHIRDAVSQGPFQNWNPRLVQYVSPQVWASRPGRAQRIASTHDLLLSILPFEKEWYARRTPALRVEFVGHPLVDRHQPAAVIPSPVSSPSTQSPELLLLPGSRMGEIVRHVPVMVETARRLHASHGVQCRMVLPSESLASMVRPMLGTEAPILVQLGGLSQALLESTAALACTGTVTLECAWFGVPTVTLYKTNWLTYTIGKRIVTVPYLSMPNLLAGGAVMPEFVQDAATSEALSAALVPFLTDPAARSRAKEQLAQVRNQLGTPGASHRAAAAILSLLPALANR